MQKIVIEIKVRPRGFFGWFLYSSWGKKMEINDNVNIPTVESRILGAVENIVHELNQGEDHYGE